MGTRSPVRGHSWEPFLLALVVILGCQEAEPPRAKPDLSQLPFGKFLGTWKGNDGTRLTIDSSGNVTGGLYLPQGGLMETGQLISLGGVMPAALQPGSTENERIFEVRILIVNPQGQPWQQADPEKTKPIRVTLLCGADPNHLRLDAGESASLIQGLILSREKPVSKYE